MLGSNVLRGLGVVGLALVVTTASGCAVETAVGNTTSTSTTTTSVSLAHANLSDAKREWIAGARVASVVQSTYLRRSAADLTRAIDDGLSDAGADRRAVSHLRQLASLPETSDTPAQIAEAKVDLAALNRFFATKNLYD
jgi:hypothetical protein